jgi:hypothetical protein
MRNLIVVQPSQRSAYWKHEFIDEVCRVTPRSGLIERIEPLYQKDKWGVRQSVSQRY